LIVEEPMFTIVLAYAILVGTFAFIGVQPWSSSRFVATLFAAGVLLPLGRLMCETVPARPGSIVGAASRRRALLIALGGSAMTLFVASGAQVVACLMLAVLVAGIALDLHALVAVARPLAAVERLRRRTPSSPPTDGETEILDYGIGEEELEELGPSALVYRERERVVRLVRGSPAAARRALLIFILFDVGVALPPSFMWAMERLPPP
jgi:hypothetical protein